MKIRALIIILCAVGQLSWAARINVPVGKITAGPCIEIVLPGGARGMYCVPSQGWNGDVLVFAHGYTATSEPLDYQNLEFGEVYLPELAQQLGFAFATTTYRQTGLAILEGVEDIRQLVQQFRSATGRRAQRFIMSGASEGGIVTTLLMERYPELFAGALSLCGPIGNFRFQTDYIGDFRTLFDYYFPAMIPGDTVNVPANVLDDWYTIYIPAILSAIRSNPSRAEEMLRVAGAAYVPGNADTIENTFSMVLWYHAFGSADALSKLGEHYYSNAKRRYRGSSNDLALNAGVKRYSAINRPNVATLKYNTTGKVSKPMVVLHTTGDEVIPYRHDVIYQAKVNRAGSDQVAIFPVERYGHCNFNINELLGGLLFLLREMR